MKRVVVYLVSGAFLIVLGFIAGRLVEHAKSGFYYKLHETKEYGAALGRPVQWKLSFESVGARLMTDATTTIEFDNRVIYRALANWNEGVPYAANVKVSGDSINWDDREYQYHLEIQKMKSEQADPANRHPSGTSGDS